MIGHRIHDEDLSANLLRGGEFEPVILPMIAPRNQTYRTAYGSWPVRKGELLRPDDFGKADIERIRNSVNPSFDLFYQQDVDGQSLPAIKAEYFLCCEPSLLRNLPCVVSVDAGAKKSASNSFSVVQVWAYDKENRYLLDQFRERCDFHELGQATYRLAKRYHAHALLVEEAANGAALISELTRRQRQRVVAIVPRGSESSRLRPHLEKIVAGRIRVPSDADYRDVLVQELVEFPHGKHTDQADALSQAMTWLDENGEASAPTPRESPGFIAVGCNSQITGPAPRRELKQTGPRLWLCPARCAVDGKGEDEVHTIGDPSWLYCGLGLEPIDEIGPVVEPAAGTTADAASSDNNGERNLAIMFPPIAAGVRTVSGIAVAEEVEDDIGGSLSAGGLDCRQPPTNAAERMPTSGVYPQGDRLAGKHWSILPGCRVSRHGQTSNGYSVTIHPSSQQVGLRVGRHRALVVIEAHCWPNIAPTRLARGGSRPVVLQIKYRNIAVRI